jgi:peptidoglycan/LPS O-acetylase OafA/YrhL
MTESAKNSSSPRHIARLDVVRALAFLAVYAFHFTGNFQRARIPWNGQVRDFSVWPREALVLLPAIYGWLGVTLFFVLSGFCIHYSTRLRPGIFSARDFFWRRFLRLYPAYLVALAVTGVLDIWLPSKHLNFWQFPVHLLLIHNLNNETFFGINGAFWSLAVEAQFYLLYPLLLYLSARWGLAKSLVLALVLNLILYVYFGRTSTSANPVHVTWGFPLVTWCDWILGAILAEAYLEGRKVFTHERTWLICSGLFLVIGDQFKTLHVQGYLIGSVFFTVALQWYLGRKGSLLLLERALIPVGIVSYSLYLWHEPIEIGVDMLGAHWHAFSTPLSHVIFDVVTASVLCVPVAAASYYFLEVKAAVWIRGFFKPSRAPDLPGIVREAGVSVP